MNTSAPRLRALLIDDEMLARLGLRQALASHPRIEIVGECGNASEARQAIEALAPDLVFLDIRMPGLDGLALLRTLPAGAAPMVVLVTAFDQHACSAFDLDAIDYVLKPLDQKRFDRAIGRVMTRWAERGHAPLPAVAETFRERLSVRQGEHIRVLRAEEIDWIKADGNYVRIRAAGAEYMHRETLACLEASLDPSRFQRIHRAIVVNLDRVSEVHPLFHGSFQIVLRDGTRLPLSRRFRGRAGQTLGLR